MPIRVECPACQQAQLLEPEAQGTAVACACGTRFVVALTGERASPATATALIEQANRAVAALLSRTARAMGSWAESMQDAQSSPASIASRPDEFMAAPPPATSTGTVMPQPSVLQQLIFAESKPSAKPKQRFQRRWLWDAMAPLGALALAVRLPYFGIPLFLVAVVVLAVRFWRRPGDPLRASLEVPMAVLSALGVCGIAFLAHPILGILAIAGFLLWLWSLKSHPADTWHQHQGGQVLGDSATLRPKSLAAFGRQPTLTWGGVLIPESDAPRHFCIVGITGSGKTLTMRLLMQEILPQIATAPDTRAVIYDAKRDSLQVLAGMNHGAPVQLLNPFDDRGVAWDLAADITTPTAAREIAAILFPEKNESVPFFTIAARALISHLMMALHQLAPGRWTLRDVMLGTHPRHLKAILSRVFPETHLVMTYFDGKEFPSVITTITAGLSRFEAVASAWAQTTERVSLTRWAEDRSILVLATDPMNEDAMNAVNGMIIQRLCQILLSQGESDQRRSWVFLDEFRGTGELTGLPKLLTAGRSKGVCVVIGFQDMGGLKEAYGEHVPAEITGMCQHKAFFRLEDPDTAEWASSVLGEEDRREYSTSYTQARDNSKTQSSERLYRRIVPPDSLKILPIPDRETGLAGYYTSPRLGRYYHHYSGPIMREALASPDSATLNFDEREYPHFLAPWTSEDLERLQLTGVIDAQGPAHPPAAPSTGPKPGPKSSLSELNRIVPPR